MPTGSAVQRLVARKMALDAVPPGGGMGSALAFLQNRERLAASGKAAQEWALAAISAVRQAEDPNPWRHASDEEIAAELVRAVDEKESERLRERQANLMRRMQERIK